MALTRAARLARPRRWPAGLAWMLWVLVMGGLAVVAWQVHLLRQAGRPDLVLFGAFAAVPVLTMVSASTAGVVLGSRRPSHPVGWLLLAFGLSLTANGAAAGYLAYGLLARPGALPATRSVVLYYPAALFTAQVLLGFVLLLTPTGKLPSPSWRWWARAMMAALVAVLVAVALAPGLVNPRYQAATSPFDFRGLGGALLVANQVGLAVTTLAVVVGAASLVVRFRHARAVERLQLRWVALAAAPLALMVPIVVAGSAMGSPGLLDELLAVCVASMPLAIAAAILRYRLYDLDRIISRTLTYGCSPCCWAAATPAWSWGLASSSAATHPWWWPGRPWQWPRCSGRPAAAPRAWWTAASTGAATTPPTPLRRSAPGCASRSNWRT
jgi:hypothetical protein